jgi:hypothetical protein
MLKHGAANERRRVVGQVSSERPGMISGAWRGVQCDQSFREPGRSARDATANVPITSGKRTCGSGSFTAARE